MMKLDGSLASLFLEQKKRIQAKKDEKNRISKEKVLVRDFKIKVCVSHGLRLIYKCILDYFYLIYFYLLKKTKHLFKTYR